MNTYDKISELTREHARQAVIQKENVVIQQLAKLGHQFERGEAFNKFIKERLTMVSHEGEEHDTLWLDFGKDDCHIIAQFYKLPKVDFNYDEEAHRYEVKIDIGRIPAIKIKPD